MKQTKEISIRTDLAIEAREIYRGSNTQEVPGVEVSADQSEDIMITRVNVLDEQGEKAMGKPVGNYVTIEVPRLKEADIDLQEEVAKKLAKELIGLSNLKENDTILVVGLGNWNVTPDALGPKVVESLLVTRHLKEYIPDQIDESVRPVSAIAPGVMGLTGIETSEIIEGVVKKVKPNLVICIDALASRKMQRVSTTIQIADTGIRPGSGVGNKRKGISQDVLGVPVIAIGVPTVVDAATMASDTIDMVVDTLIQQTESDSTFYKMLRDMDKNEKNHLIYEVLTPYIGNLMVTPKEVDTIINDLAKIIANGLNMSLHPGIDEKDINRFLH